MMRGLKIGLVGPLPPPAGGMATQTQQLGELLQREGAQMTIVQVNAAYWPRWIATIRGIRAVCRLIPFVARLYRVAGRVDLLHVMANSGWSWHLFATPAVWIAHARGIPAVVNYRGGEAEAFLARSGSMIRRTMRRASVLVVPSEFLREVFERHGIASKVVPNIVDLRRFHPADAVARPLGPRLVVARNLERIYDIPTAIHAFAVVRQRIPGAQLIVAGSGPELEKLTALAAKLGIAEAVDFCGRLDRDQMASLYRSADALINPSRVDNMPNSVLEAMASGVPIVSTNVGGIPYILRHGVNAFLVDAEDHAALAASLLHVLSDGDVAAKLRTQALADVQQYAWPKVKQRWSDLYASVLAGAHVGVRPA